MSRATSDATAPNAHGVFLECKKWSPSCNTQFTSQWKEPWALILAPPKQHLPSASQSVFSCAK